MEYKTTATYPNRIEDKNILENKLNLTEFGNSITKFGYNKNILFEGYERIVYGDHGPYIEFSLKHIKCKLISKFGNEIDYNNLPGDDFKYYYFWLMPENFPGIKVYLQIKPVHNLPNAPKRDDGKRSKFNRKEGYADYKRGYFYVDPYSIDIILD